MEMNKIVHVHQYKKITVTTVNNNMFFFFLKILHENLYAVPARFSRGWRRPTKLMTSTADLLERITFFCGGGGCRDGGDDRGCETSLIVNPVGPLMTSMFVPLTCTTSGSWTRHFVQHVGMVSGGRIQSRW